MIPRGDQCLGASVPGEVTLDFLAVPLAGAGQCVPSRCLCVKSQPAELHGALGQTRVASPGGFWLLTLPLESSWPARERLAGHSHRLSAMWPPHPLGPPLLHAGPFYSSSLKSETSKSTCSDDQQPGINPILKQYSLNSLCLVRGLSLLLIIGISNRSWP